ncbi:MAG: GAP family protein [Streptomycetaceae bacterium]|nr:GAP family protein [Streptomycetaceae bacterium]
MDLEILPLAFTMMVGPQIMSAIILVTTPRPVRVSLAFLLGVAAATTIGLSLVLLLGKLLEDAFDLGDPSDRGSAGNIIQYVLVGLLAFAALRSYLTRATAEPPKWLGTLMTADPKRALKTGLLLILLMPSDIVVMLTVGTNLRQHDSGLVDALPFIAATVLIAALPLLAYLAMGARAKRAMPKVRDWTNANSWVISIAAYLIFIVLIL